MEPASLLPLLLGLAVLAPLASFFLILVCGPRLGKAGRNAAHISIIAIVTSALFSFLSLGVWCTYHWPEVGHAAGEHSPHQEGPLHESPPGESSHAGVVPANAEVKITSVSFSEGSVKGAPSAEHSHDAGGSHEEASPVYSGTYYVLGRFGQLTLSIGYYIDSLTIVMFCMVTLIASCIHFYASGYMHDELHDFEDTEVPAPKKLAIFGHDSSSHDSSSHGEHVAAAHAHEVPAHGHGHAAHGDHAHGDDGHDDHGHGHKPSGNFLVRPGRYHRFFQALSLFCFSMLGLVLAGNIGMVFVFWELVGICSYFLIGFYVERTSASTAANKAFITNRVGDFGMIIGLVALWGSLGTFDFGDTEINRADGSVEKRVGLFHLVRPGPHGALQTPDGMVRMGAQREVSNLVSEHRAAQGSLLHFDAKLAEATPQWRAQGYGYWLLVIAGIGIFCGCVGKSAQFPLHVWLPDAMEGPTPVSALVHSATMVAAGVYLVGRFFPVFTPEVLLVIASIGTITLFLAASIAITATDIKRVLAYSTVSQLGYMMMALGVGGWLAGMMHLVTHAFFKSLLFLCSGSVIHAVHTNEMTAMGGLRKKMPITSMTMLIGCLAIAGAGIPFVIGLSGYYSKDAILEQALSFWNNNAPWGGVFFVAAAGGAAMTAFYMFRLWFLTFAGEPRDQGRYDHAHESPGVMYVPLIVLAVFAVGVAWQPFSWSPIKYPTLSGLLEQARPRGTLDGMQGTWGSDPKAEASQRLAGVDYFWPNEHASHAPAIKTPVTLLAFGTAVAGILMAALFYGLKWLNPDEVKQQFLPIYTLLRNKWYFDEIYQIIFIQPVLGISKLFAAFDKKVIDALIDGIAWFVRGFSVIWERVADRTIVDGLANLTASWTWSLGLSLRGLQTGRLRQYVMFIVVGAVALFVLISFFWRSSLAG